MYLIMVRLIVCYYHLVMLKENARKKYISNSKERPNRALNFAENFMKIERRVQKICPFEHFKIAVFYQHGGRHFEGLVMWPNHKSANEQYRWHIHILVHVHCIWFKNTHFSFTDNYFSQIRCYIIFFDFLAYDVISPQPRSGIRQSKF